MALAESAEIEFKFLINNDLKDRLHDYLTAQGKPQATLQLDNRYFDTPEGYLHAHKIGLRIRGWNDQFEQTVKFAGTQTGAYSCRPEYTAPLAVSEAKQGPQWQAFAILPWPAEVAASIESQWRQLTEQFRVAFTRQRWHIELADAVLEVVLDDGEIVAAGRSEPIREVEVELLAGNPSSCIAWAQELQVLFALISGEQSKAQRGFALAAQTDQ